MTQYLPQQFFQLSPYIQQGLELLPLDNKLVSSGRELHAALICVVLAPLVWNIVARTIRNLLPKSTPMAIRYIICYLLAVWIFGFSSYRDYLFKEAISSQPTFSFFSDDNLRYAVSGVLICVGQLFVWSSFAALGITGTFLGDYCGILMDAPVTSFPFNVLNNPMYIGSTLSFLGTSLFYGSWAGLLITAEVFIVYQIALMFEGPYTAMIYQERARQQKSNKKAQ